MQKKRQNWIELSRETSFNFLTDNTQSCEIKQSNARTNRNLAICKKSKTRCIKRIRVSKHQKCDGLSTVQTVQLKQLLFICGKLQIGNGFLQCYQISHNTRIRWGFFFLLLASFLLTNIKCKAGGRVRLMNELRHQDKKKSSKNQVTMLTQ